MSTPADPLSPTSTVPRPPPRPRIESIDHLRGVLAVSVMLYHITSWAHVALPTLFERFLFRSGIYAVLSFYVVSGISFGYVYGGMRLNPPELVEFWVKRFFRLAPLYWFAMVGVIGLAAVKTFGRDAPFPYSAAELALNATLTFGVLDPAAAMVTGGWSIGNEMAYYVVFPFVVAASRRWRWSRGPIVVASVAIGAPFAWLWIVPTATLGAQWTTYIHPLSHLFYFVAGVVVSLSLAPARFSSAAAAGTLVVLLVAYTLGPGGGDQASIVTNAPWAFYSLLCVAACAVVYAAAIDLPRPLSSLLGWLGCASYSVYLLHPLVYRALTLLHPQHPWLRVLGSVAITLLLSHVVYHRVELPMIDAGRRLAPRLAARFGRREPATRSTP